MEFKMIYPLVLVHILGLFAVVYCDEELILSPSKLDMFVDEIPDIPRIKGYDVVHGVPVSKKLKITMFQKYWVIRLHKTSTGETPFSLTYGTEAMIPVEIGLPTHRVANQRENEKELRCNLDLLEERREAAAIREAKYKRTLEKYYNSRVREYKFKVGEYVMRSNEASGSEKPGKMSPRWEGPYVVISVGEKGAYKLATLSGDEVPRTWNGVHLKKCYI